MILLYTLGGLFITSHLKAQVVLEALDAPNEKCLERVYDKYYGDGVHNYIYCAVQGPNGKKWLNLNLGAEYAKESSPHFNPEAVPTDYNDWKAFGNLYHWGRDSDGHEQVEYRQGSESWEFRPVNGVRTTLVGPGETSNQMVSVRGTPYYASYDLGPTWLQDPCPEGYRVMQRYDVLALGNISALSGGLTNTSIVGNLASFPDLRIVTGPLTYGVSRSDVWNGSLTYISWLELGGSAMWINENHRNTPLMYKGNSWQIATKIHQEGYPWMFTRSFIAGGDPNAEYGIQPYHINDPVVMVVRCVQK